MSTVLKSRTRGVSGEGAWAGVLARFLSVEEILASLWLVLDFDPFAESVQKTIFKEELQ